MNATGDRRGQTQRRSLDDLLDTQPKTAQIKRYIKEVSNEISDHMPVVTRFFFEERS